MEPTPRGSELIEVLKSAEFYLRKALEIIDGLKGFALANVQLADGHQRNLILRLVLQNVLVFRNGLGDLALV